MVCEYQMGYNYITIYIILLVLYNIYSLFPLGIIPYGNVFFPWFISFSQNLIFLFPRLTPAYLWITHALIILLCSFFRGFIFRVTPPLFMTCFPIYIRVFLSLFGVCSSCIYMLYFSLIISHFFLVIVMFPPFFHIFPICCSIFWSYIFIEKNLFCLTISLDLPFGTFSTFKYISLILGSYISHLVHSYCYCLNCWFDPKFPFCVLWK